jgi:hypothetical protein
VVEEMLQLLELKMMDKLTLVEELVVLFLTPQLVVVVLILQVEMVVLAL